MLTGTDSVRKCISPLNQEACVGVGAAECNGAGIDLREPGALAGPAGFPRRRGDIPMPSMKVHKLPAHAPVCII